jgi:hypothetical protein
MFSKLIRAINLPLSIVDTLIMKTLDGMAGPLGEDQFEGKRFFSAPGEVIANTVEKEKS